MAAFGDIFLSDAISEPKGIGEIFISELVGKFGSLNVKELFPREGAEEKLKKLSRTLCIIEEILIDAEEQQITKASVKECLKDLRYVWYDIDDIFDEIEARYQIKKSQRVGESSSSRYTAAPEDEKAIIDRKMMQRIDAITRELDRLSNLKKDFNLVEMSKRRSKPKYEYMKQCPLLDSLVCGRDNEREIIITLLLGNDDMLVIPIIGMGGIGKTTLAKIVYFDERVEKCFDVKAWTCVSDDYNVVAIIKKIYEDVTGTASDSHNLDTLLMKLKGKLADKKFLIVLDDVWNHNYMAWDTLRSSLYGKPGSRIIVTTRIQHVVDTLGSPLVTRRLRYLRSEECLSILRHHAEVLFNENPDLEDIGLKLVEKCDGLPLAAKALGGVLRSKKKKEDWENVLHSDIWNQPLGNEILPVLRLSYKHLPSHLKNLFAHCAIFPKDYQFDKNKLVHLWMAEGLIKEGDARKSKEKIGLECFDDLHSRSFFQPLRSNSSSTFLMHDLMNDLARHVAGGICHHFEEKKNNDLPPRVYEKLRHSSYRHCDSLSFDKFQNLPRAKGLRSFFQLPTEYDIVHMSNKVLVDVILKLHCLRVLSLCGHVSIRKLPDSLFELIHLRYLDLSRTSIVELPDSVGNLVFLEFLLLRLCYKLKKLPKSLGSLSKLRQLDNTCTNLLMCLPAEIGTLKSLQVFPNVVLDSKGGFRLKHLEDLMLLEGILSISHLEYATSDEDGMGKYLVSMSRLEKLELRWDGWFYRQDLLGYTIPPEDVLEMLQPHENLRELRIYHYEGSRFPTWTGDELFRNLSEVRLEWCFECSSLPPLGQLPILECLYLNWLPNVERIDEGFYGNSTTPFPKLHTLHLVGFSKLREWIGLADVDGISCVKFNCLGELAITECQQLETAPQLICPSLSHLTIRSCGEGLLQKFSNLNSLEQLSLKDDSGLVHLPPRLVESLVALKKLKIELCNQLISVWPEGNRELACHLEMLQLQQCRRLRFLPIDLSNLRSCEKIEIIDCPELVISPGNQFPPITETLRFLEVRNSPQLGIDPERMSSCMSLESLILDGCGNSMKLFRNGLPSNLLELRVTNCADLESLPREIITMESLQILEISHCSGLINFPSIDLPPSLLSLTVTYCKMLRPLKEWRLHNLSRLTDFSIRGGYEELEHLIDTNLLFPPSLERLRIEGFPKLISLADVLENLHSLRELSIRDCEKMDVLPSERVLKNLSRLEIFGCPILRKKCAKDKGEYWPKIAHIPEAEMEDFFFLTDEEIKD